MTQKHVDLLMEAVNVNEEYKYLCNRIGYITGWYYYPLLRNTKYNEDDYIVLTEAIKRNIMSNLSDGSDKAEEHTYISTTFYEQGMTRKEWAETILAPLALEIEED